MSFNKITGSSRYKQKDTNGVTGLVFISHFMENTVTSEKNNKKYKVTAGTTFFLEEMGVKLRTPKRDEPPLTSNVPLVHHAFEKARYLKMFDQTKKGFPEMCIYKAVGIVRAPYPNKETGLIQESLNVAQLRPQLEMTLDKVLPSIPFEQTSFREDRDFLDVITDVGAFVIDVKPSSVVNKELQGTLTKDDDWYPDQPDGSVWATTMCNSTDNVCKYRFSEIDPETGEPAPFENGILGKGTKESGEPVHFYARQKNPDGTYFTVDVSMRMQENTCAYFRSKHWQVLGPQFLEHLEGTLIGSTFIKNTQTLKNPDPSTFHYYIQLNGDLIPNVENMVRTSGFKVSRKVAMEAMKAYAPADKFEYTEVFGSMPVTAHNLTCVEYPETVMEKLLMESDFYVIGNWYPVQRKHVHEMDSEEDQIKALTDAAKGGIFWVQGETPTVNVYAVPRQTTDSPSNKRTKLDE